MSKQSRSGRCVFGSHILVLDIYYVHYMLGMCRYIHHDGVKRGVMHDKHSDDAMTIY